MLPDLFFSYLCKHGTRENVATCCSSGKLPQEKNTSYSYFRVAFQTKIIKLNDFFKY